MAGAVKEWIEVWEFHGASKSKGIEARAGKKPHESLRPARAPAKCVISLPAYFSISIFLTDSCLPLRLAGS
jgi:hypothetical protein